MTTEPDVEIYPMPSFATLSVSDIEASAAWYREALGFTHIFTMPGPGGGPRLVHLRWIKYADLLLFPDAGETAAEHPKGVGVALNYAADDVDRLAERARSHGARLAEGPIDRPWNIRELVILDPDGYRLVFNAPRMDGMHRDFDEIVAAVAGGFQDTNVG